jgi:hypothetical protein
MATKSEDAKEPYDSWTVYRGPHKLILFGENRYPMELYDLEGDSGEKQPLADHDVTSQLLVDYQSWLEQVRASEGDQTIELDQEIREMLESLGYLEP